MTVMILIQIILKRFWFLMLTFYYFVVIMNQGSYKPPWYEPFIHISWQTQPRPIGKLKYNKNL